MTYLSVKALGHYHDVGLLEPAAVDASTGSGGRLRAGGRVGRGAADLTGSRAGLHEIGAAERTP